MSRNRGFTLIELMITMVIVGVIAAIAFPAFTKSAMKGRRADAKESLTRISQALERCYTQYGLYNSSNCTPFVDTTPAFVTQTSKQGYYSITATTFNGTQYKLTATAVSSGPQNNDTGCTVMNLDNTDQHSSGSSTATADTGSCW